MILTATAPTKTRPPRNLHKFHFISSPPLLPPPALVDETGNLMASSDDEEESVPQSINNYFFEDGNSEPVSFATLPVYFESDENPGVTEGQVFLHGTADGGLQKVFKQVTAWRLGLQDEQLEISVLSKDGKWTRLLKPRKIYEEETARTILVTVHALHLLRKNPELSEKSLWPQLYKIFSFESKPSEDDFRDHYTLIRKFMERDEKLANCQLLPVFLKERPRKRISSEDVQNEPVLNKAFIADDDEMDGGMGDDDGDDSEEEPDLFDSVCAICDNGGELLCCEGRCLRSFHATIRAGSDSDCTSLGYSRFQVEAIQNFLCKNCQYKRHQCFACGKLGSSDKSAGAEVFSCVNATCGYFYHPRCAARLIYRDNEAEAAEYEKKIAAGESFMCPVHKCVVCDKGENKVVKDLQFAVCRRCPKSYHRQCLPREIAFDDIEEEDIIQRAWDDLLPNRILIYCLDHKIDEELGTPKRNHIIFPEIFEKKKLLDLQKNKVKILPKKKSQDFDSLPMKRKFQDSENLPMKKKTQNSDKLLKDQTFLKPKQMIQKKIYGAEGGSSLIKNDRTLTEQMPESKKKMKLLKGGGKPDSWKAGGTVPVDSKTFTKEKTQTSALALPPISSMKKSSFPVIDGETEKKIMGLMAKISSSMTLEAIIRKRTVPSTHSYSARNIDKSITPGKVEGSVEAIRTALKKVEDGGSVEDAKAVCEPDILKQLLRWNSKLKVYLSPFLHGVRYTSFGRHFTKVDKLVEIVDKLQWYVQSGDTIVDFCCGANDFSLLMREKLDATGKKCSYKNFDVIQPKNDFSFEKRDWMTVQPKELPTGSQLIMGLNPPFGVKASLANKFIDKALTFRPKLIILIVPPETERLDEKRTPYDLIWEDLQKLSGKSFYLPGSVDVNDKQIEQWNNTPPPLYLWSRSDWTSKHRAIASKQGHIEKGLNESPSEEAPLERKMEAAPLERTMAAPPPVKGHIEEIHENRDAALGREASRASNKNTEPNNTKISPGNAKKKNRRRGKKNRKEEASIDRKVNESSDMSISPRRDDTRDTRELPRGRVTSEALEGPSERSYTPSERTSNQVTLPRPGVFDEDIDTIAKRYTTPSNTDSLLNNGSRNWSGAGIGSLDYGIRGSEEHLQSYTRDDTYGRKPSMNDYDGYGRGSMYGMQGQEGRFSLSGSGTTLGQAGRYSSSSFGLSSSATGSSTMQRYAPRLDETNYPRPGSLSLGVSLPSGSGIYDIPGIRPPDSSGFAPGPHHLNPRQGSSGWLND